MKFLLFSHISPPATDGGSRLLSQIGQHLSKNHTVETLSSDCQSTDDFINPRSKSQKNGLPVYKFLYRPFKLLSLIFPSILIFAKGPIFKFIPLVKTIIKIQKFKPDFVIAGPFPTTIPIYALIFSRLINPRPKLILIPCFHFSDPVFSKNILLNILRQADFIWSLTGFETTMYINKFGIHSNHILTLGASIDIDTTPLPKPKIGNQNLLYVGSFAAHKGIDVLIDSFSALSKKFSSLSLTLAGHPTLYSPFIYQKIQKLPKNLTQRITVIPNFKDCKLAAIIDKCSILVLPSKQESFGLVLLEAMSRKKPIITSDIPALAEMVDCSRAGKTFSINHPSDLKNVLDELLQDPTLRQKLGLCGYKYLQNSCNWDKIIDNLCQNIYP
ncbi:MAG: glycosyltransferase [Candidatus Shapirobacteria bacterium]|jgi:glycosyltransferase involved in cell wall biosynthesis